MNKEKEFLDFLLKRFKIEREKFDIVYNSNKR